MSRLIILKWSLHVPKRYFRGHKLHAQHKCLLSTCLVEKMTNDGSLQAVVIPIEQGIEVLCSILCPHKLK